jgi:hypothetical protein
MARPNRAVDAEARFIRCDRKDGYTNARARQIAKRMRRQKDGIRVHEYYCRDCQKWHIGERFEA